MLQICQQGVGCCFQKGSGPVTPCPAARSIHHLQLYAHVLQEGAGLPALLSPQSCSHSPGPTALLAVV